MDVFPWQQTSLKADWSIISIRRGESVPLGVRCAADCVKAPSSLSLSLYHPPSPFVFVCACVLRLQLSCSLLCLLWYIVILLSSFLRGIFCFVDFSFIVLDHVWYARCNTVAVNLSNHFFLPFFPWNSPTISCVSPNKVSAYIFLIMHTLHCKIHTPYNRRKYLQITRTYTESIETYSISKKLKTSRYTISITALKQPIIVFIYTLFHHNKSNYN